MTNFGLDRSINPDPVLYRLLENLVTVSHSYKLILVAFINKCNLVLITKRGTEFTKGLIDKALSSPILFIYYTMTTMFKWLFSFKIFIFMNSKMYLMYFNSN